MKKIFIAATLQNVGKTTTALGMILNLKKDFKSVGFIKPVGQRYLEEQGFKIDEDSILVESSARICGIKCSLKDTSPVAVEKGFTEKYILSPDPQAISKQIRQAFERISKGKELVIIEGTGHAGVGSVFDHSNAHVAKLLGSKVILISSGGVGRPIDEILLNKAMFDQVGVKLLGVIVNKVMSEKFDRINTMVRKGLRRKGVEVLGVIPYNPILSYPTVRHVMDEGNFKLHNSEAGKALDSRIAKFVVGAMQPKDAAKYLVDQSLIITPGDREDIMRMAIESHRQGRRISGIVLTGDIMPGQEIISQLKEAAIPILLSKQDTYTVASTVHDINVKIRPEDKEKIEMVKNMINNYVSMDRIIQRI